MGHCGLHRITGGCRAVAFGGGVAAVADTFAPGVGQGVLRGEGKGEGRFARSRLLFGFAA